MRETYDIKYRQPGQWLWRKVKSVKGDGVEHSFRYFHTEKDELIYISLDAEVKFPKERQDVITHKMSKQAGTPIQRA